MKVGVINLNTALAEKFEYAQSSEKMSSRERTISLGQLAIRMDQLGINDPLTHLFQRVEKGKSAEIGILEDLITDIAERLPKTPFVNQINYEIFENDFVSCKDRVSMRRMTENNLKVFSDELSKNSELKIEYERAEIEAREVEAILCWFKGASVGSYLIFESLPIGDQKIAISRIYQKKSKSILEGSFVSLYNPSVEIFNEFRSQVGGDRVARVDELDVLRNHYEYFDGKLVSSLEFIDYYVSVYDKLLSKKRGGQFSFGIESDVFAKKRAINNGIEKVRKQNGLTKVYMDAVQALASSDGVITPELRSVCNVLDSDLQISVGERISVGLARDILSNMITRITSVIDRANDDILSELEYSGGDANYSAVSIYGDEAKSYGEDYSSNACPELARAQHQDQDDAKKSIFSDDELEYELMMKAFNTPTRLKMFGRPKIGVCRIPNCPSRGNMSWMPDKTLVGGCNVCVCCHKHFQKGKSPEAIYKEQERENKRKKKQEERELKRMRIDYLKEKKSKQKK